MTRIFKAIRKSAPGILSALAIFGLTGTAALTVKATLSTKARLDDISSRAKAAGEEADAKEKARAIIQECAAPAAVFIFTALCICYAHVLDTRRQAALTAACLSTEGIFKAYRERIKELGGETLDHAAEKQAGEKLKDEKNDAPPWDEIQTFHLDGYPRFFETTMENVCRAEYVFNRNFVLRGYVTFNELLHFLNVDDIGEKGDDIGWEEYEGEATYGYRWIDFDHIFRHQGDMVICDISLPFAPHKLFSGGVYARDETIFSCGTE